MDIVKTEYLLRLSAISLLVLTACLVGFDAQTKLIFHSFFRTATFRDMNALVFICPIIPSALTGVHRPRTDSIRDAVVGPNQSIRAIHPSQNRIPRGPTQESRKSDDCMSSIQITPFHSKFDFEKDERLGSVGSTTASLMPSVRGWCAQVEGFFYMSANTLFSINVVLVWVDSVAAGYNLLHLLAGTSICSRIKRNNNPVKVSHPYLAWVCFLLDQATVYIVFAANSAAMEASFLAVTGSSIFQWMKVCNRFTRFCFQIGGALFTGFITSVLLAALSFLSAFSLFRFYSPNQFLLLKSR